MILQIDMGNTRIKWRLRKDSGNVAHGSAPNANNFAALADGLRGYHIQQIWVASVLGKERDQSLTDWAQQHLGLTPQFAHSQLRCRDVVNGYHLPERLGVDRWLALVAGFARVRSSCVIVDCGSAITVDILNFQGVHQGGYIAPGFALMRQVLALNTHAVKVSGEPPALELTPGRNTETAVAAAQRAMTKGLVENAIQQAISANQSAPRLLLTGGDAQWVKQLFNEALVVPDLIFEGLELTFSCS